MGQLCNHASVIEEDSGSDTSQSATRHNGQKYLRMSGLIHRLQFRAGARPKDFSGSRVAAALDRLFNIAVLKFPSFSQEDAHELNSEITHARDQVRSRVVSNVELSSRNVATQKVLCARFTLGLTCQSSFMLNLATA